MTRQVQPPKLRDLVARAHKLGYEMPEIETGDMRDPDNPDVMVAAVQVQLHSNQYGRRNVVAHCRVLPMRDSRKAHRVAARSALAKALELAESPIAVANLN